jgi:hypothetical protein
MADILVLDTLHPIAKQLYAAAEGLRKALAVYDELQVLRGEAIPLGAAKFTEVMGVTSGQQAFSDQMAKLKVGATQPATLAELRSFVGLCAPAATVV